MSIGWVADLTDADDYFETRSGAGSWSSLTDNAKTTALTTAYNEIYNSSDLEIPSSPSSTQTVRLKYAQLEWTLIHALYPEAILQLRTLTGMGVTSSKAMGESYDLSNIRSLPTWLLTILNEFTTGLYGFTGSQDAYRNIEDETDEDD